MQALDLPCKPPLDPSVPDPSVMSEQKSSPIRSNNAENSDALVESSSKNENSVGKKNSSKNNGSSTSNSVVVKRERPSRACTQRAAERMQAAARAEAEMEAERKRKRATRKQRLAARLLKEEDELDDEEEGFDDVGDEDNVDGDDGGSQTSTTITPLVGDLEDSQFPRWNLRSMWELASILNFLNVFRPLLNINVEFSAEELETALLTPNNTLADVHMPLLKAIPPVIRMALGPGTWITVLCRKLRDWWHWVAEGDLPIVASHGKEIEAYHELDPGVRVTILKALCDIRVEQEDIKIFIDDSIKNGAHLSLFRKQRIGGDSHGVSYWYEDDPIIGHRLYREIRKVEVKRAKGKNVPQIPHSSYHWEAVATNLDEFVNVSEKLFASKNRTEVSVGKKLKNDMIPEIEKVHKRKERLLKKQHREALMLDSIMHVDGLGGGRSLRDRKPVTYTFDDYDRSINEALKFTKDRQQSPEPHESRERDPHARNENFGNGGWAGTLRSTRQDNFSAPSPMSDDEDDMPENHETEIFDDQKNESLDLDRGNRRRQRPQRYAQNDFIEGISDNEADPESDDDIVGEAVYDEEYLRKRKRRRKASSSEEGDEEYKWDEEENPEEEEEDEEEEDNSLSTSEEDSDEQPRKFRNLRGRTTRRETRLRSVRETQTGLRRSKRSTRNRVNYKLYEMSESENELMKPEEKSAAEQSDASGNDEDEYPYSFQDFDEEKMYEQEQEKETHMEHGLDHPTEEKEPVETVDGNKEETDNENPPESVGDDDQEDTGLRKRRFLDLNELAPGTGFDDGPNSTRDDDPSGF